MLGECSNLFSQMYLKRHDFKSLKLIGKYSDIDKFNGERSNCGFVVTLKKEKRGGGKLRRLRFRRVYFEREL